LVMYFLPLGEIQMTVPSGNFMRTGCGPTPNHS